VAARFAEHQPVSVTINAVRALTRGAAAGEHATRAVVWPVAIMAVCVPIALLRFSRRD
jgi:hypothetical protein